MAMNTTCLEKIKIIARSIHLYLFPFVEKLEEAKFIESRHGKPMLLDRNGQGFTSEKKHGVNTYWQVVNPESKVGLTKGSVLPELLQREFTLKVGDVSIIIHLKILRIKTLPTVSPSAGLFF